MPKIKTLLTEIEPRLDRNSNSFWRLKLAGLPDYFYAFATDYNLSGATLQKLQKSPDQFLNQLVLITYEEVANKDNPGNFKKVKALEII
jgi:hypothetical protein